MAPRDENIIRRIGQHTLLLLFGIRTAESAAARNLELQEIANLPSVAAAFRSTSLLSLTWSMDYRRALQQSFRLVFLQSSTWFSTSAIGFCFAWACPAAFLNSSSDILNRCAAFLVGWIISTAFSLLALVLQVSKNFPAHARIHHHAIIVEPEGICSIVGTRQYLYAWDAIGPAKNLAGLVLYKRQGALSVIPAFAFQSTTDMQAFVATLNALRAGLSPPQHDWSNYVPREVSIKGVWPPPIG